MEFWLPTIVAIARGGTTSDDGDGGVLMARRWSYGLDPKIFFKFVLLPNFPFNITKAC